ncbi:transcriptional regulator [Micromonospora zingiberis]|uniref:Transcriptional regulator n=1 Tax=Micromonospora zingiberis TaxID=2053011 RepID=A0A4R0GH48_9ACTN|nr:helix-turn-helix domain-containing protein [Micromonospora zingiberis]TCB96744.1 transcriptional regulator [Micromonospora zingiberis]
MSSRGYGQDCSIARALEVIGERWTLLIIRNAMVGDCRFESLLSNLGIARNVLAQRLNTLVEAGIFERVPYRDRPVRHEYHLTARGRELAPVLTALMQWGDKHCGDHQPNREMVHARCDHPVELVVVCPSCAGPIPTDEMVSRPITDPASMNGAPGATVDTARPVTAAGTGPGVS